MATVNPSLAPRSSPPRTSLRRRVLLLGLALLAGLAVWFWGPAEAYARTAAAFGARVACSCRYLGGRELSDCRKDFEPGMGLVALSEDTKAKTVTARFLLLANETATYRPGLGCQLEPWQG